MSDEIKVMRKDIEQLKHAVKTLEDESKSSDLDLKLEALNKSMLELDGKLQDAFEHRLSDIVQSIEILDKKLSSKIGNTSDKIDFDELKKYITKDFITKLYRG